MKRHLGVLVPALLAQAAIGALFAQSTPAPIAGTILYTKPSAADTFAAANANLTFVRADANGLVYRDAHGNNVLRAGPGLTYQQNGEWLPTKLQVASASDGSGWLLAGTTIDAKLNGGLNSDQSLTLTYGNVVFKLETPKLLYAGQDAFTFQEGSTQWVLRVSEYKISIQTTVTSRRGKSGGLHTLAFTAPAASALSTDKSGQFHVGQEVQITHPIVVGADKKFYNICTPWAQNGQNLSFSCDDTSLPDSALPYVIDPDLVTGPYWNNFNGTYYEQDNNDQGELATFTLSADFSTGGLGNITNVSWDFSNFNFYWYPSTFDPACNTTGSYGAYQGSTATWNISVSMWWYSNGSLYGCTAYATGEIYATLTYIGESVSTPSTPSGPASALPGVSYTYSTGGSIDSLSNPVQYLFNWGDGTNSGWLATGVTSVFHSWASAGSYSVTAQAQSATTQIASATSGALGLTVAWPTTTITTSSSGLTVNVDGFNYTAPHTFQWAVGSAHSLYVPSPQTNGSQYYFTSWSDGGALSHNISAPANAATFTAAFSTTQPGPSVSVTPNAVTALQGGGAAYTVTVNGFGGSSVGFSVSGLPGGATAQFSPASVSGPASTIMTVYSASTVSSFTVTATSGGNSAQANGSLNVVSSAPFTYYQTDSLTSINAANWSVVGSPTATSNGLTSSSSAGLISKLTAASGNDYDEQVTIGNCGSYGATVALYARSDPGANSNYALILQTGALIFRKSGMNLAAWPMACTNGMTLRLIVRGSTFTVLYGPYAQTVTDASITAGQPGVGVGYGATITNVKFGPIDSVPPPPVDQASLVSTAAPYFVDLQWPAGTDNPGGIGLAGYSIYRDSVYLGVTASPQWRDETVTPNSSNRSYTIYAYDQHGNTSGAPATILVSTPPATLPDQLRNGIRANGAYWGGAGEQIDMLSGNLNFTVPLIKAIAPGGSSVGIALSYNSQIWRKDTVPWLLGEDVGYGLGWRLQVGSIRPVWYNGQPDHYVFTDSTGADYRLDQNNGGVWTSTQGTYAAYDQNAGILHFPDGSFWQMADTSGTWEQDAGTIYPTTIEDSNGNQIILIYAPAIGNSLQQTNSSARISQIYDGRCKPWISGGAPPCNGGGPSYTFAYNTDSIPHLFGIGNSLGTTENYTFTTATIALQDPFPSPSSFGTAAVLQTVASTGMSTKNQFQYNSSGEMTQFTTPLGGVMGWQYATWTYSNPRSYRQVASRTLSPVYGGPTYSWQVTYGTDSSGIHLYGTVQDVGANSQKTWTFNTSPTAYTTPYPDKLIGALVQYFEGPTTGSRLLQKDFTPFQATGGQPYFSTVVTTLNPNNGQAQTTTNQSVDSHGNLLSSSVVDYGSNPTIRTYTFTYLTDANYTSKYIFNRLHTATVGTTTLVTNTYDGSPAPTCTGIQQGLTQTSVPVMHDDAHYGTSLIYRGNVTQRTGVNSTDVTCLAYDTAGLVTQAVDATGLSTQITTNSDSNYSLPGVVTPTGYNNLATTISYATSFAVTQVTTTNLSSTTTYDTLGRPSKTTIPDGAETDYTYAYYCDSGTCNGVNTQTATFVNPQAQGIPPVTPPARWKVTTLDGFGRVIQVDSGSGTVNPTNVVSRVLTQYAPCACSPLLKVKQVSQPFNPNTGSPIWTVYTYDASGRTLTVTAPDGSSVTRYTYAGNTTTIADPAGKSKNQTADAFGNLKEVVEDPSGAALTTNYTYTALNQLSEVDVVRAQTQTRTFSYVGVDLMSATNPENGTVTYTYDASHRVLTRTDAKNQQTQYTYDALGRNTQVRHGMFTNGTFTESVDQQVNYGYDNSGRLAGVGFTVDDNQGNNIPMSYTYLYSSAGKVSTQTMSWTVPNPGGTFNYGAQLSALYTWDNEGKMTSLAYPRVNGPTSGLTYWYQYDNLGRVNWMGNHFTYGDGSQYAAPIAEATYGTSGEMLSMKFGNTTVQDNIVQDAFTYNSLLQVTGLTANYFSGGTLMNMAYNYPANNNGRIASSNDNASVGGLAPESVNYTYDSVNRLIGASAGTWSEQYSYDGFGNLTSKIPTGAVPSTANMPAVTYNASNQPASLSFDPNGNQTTDAQNTTTYGWDIENRLVTTASKTSPNPTTWYGYDPWGHRVMKDANPDPNGSVGYSGGSWEFYFYGLDGRKLETVPFNQLTDWGPPGLNHYDVYFAGRLIVVDGNCVVTDRLGSVRAAAANGCSSWTMKRYMPYGEEETSTPDGADKFGTYFRDAPTQDYAEQRYYNTGIGRFWSPDPGGVSTADPTDPGSWNRYAYVGGDPVNYMDPGGLFRCNYCQTPSSVPSPPSQYNGYNGSKGPTFSSGPYSDDSEDPDTSYTDKLLNQKARGILKGRLLNFGNTHCNQVFSSVIPGYTTSDFVAEASSDDVNFYNATLATDAAFTQNQVTGNGSSTLLGTSVDTAGGQVAGTIVGGQATAIVLGANFFLNSNSVFQGNVLLHEILHAYTNGWSDDQVFQYFQKYGLKSTSPSGNSNTEDISAWLSTDCKSTPTSLTWWK